MVDGMDVTVNENILKDNLLVKAGDVRFKAWTTSRFKHWGFAVLLLHLIESM